MGHSGPRVNYIHIYIPNIAVSGWLQDWTFVTIGITAKAISVVAGPFISIYLLDDMLEHPFSWNNYYWRKKLAREIEKKKM